MHPPSPSMLKVALLQMSATPMEVGANQGKATAFCREAARMGAEVALFPEMFSHGYAFPDCRDGRAVERWLGSALEDDSEYILHFRSLARELGMAIVVTWLQAGRGEGPRNAVSVIDRSGRIILSTAKVHRLRWGAEALLSGGDSFPVASLQTAAGVVKVGCMVCYDREFPETARLLMLAGAELILTPNACNLEVNRLAQFRSRSFENAVGVAMANYPAPRCNGHSVAFDGMAHDSEGRDRDILLLEAGEAEGVYLAPFDLPALKRYRERTVWGNAYRCPELYAPLSSGEVLPPFRRDATSFPEG